MPKKAKTSAEKRRVSKKPTVYSSHVGRPREDPAVRAVDEGAARALVRLGKAGAGVVFRRAMKLYAEDRRVRSRKRPRKLSNSGLADILHVGSDARGIERMLKGERPVTRWKSARAVEQLIRHEMLAGYSSWPLALDDGHARLLAPFRPFMERFRQMGPCARPSPALLRRLNAYVREYATALRALQKRESHERTNFQSARDEMIRALLLLRAQLRKSDRLAGDHQLHSLSRKAANRATRLLEVVHGLNSLQVQTQPAPRERAQWLAESLLPAAASKDGPDFRGLFTWLAMNLDPKAADLHSAIAVHQELSGGSGWALWHADYGDNPPPSSAQWELVCLGPTKPTGFVEPPSDTEPEGQHQPVDFSEVREYDDPTRYEADQRIPLRLFPDERLAPEDLRFIRHLRRVVGEVKLRAMMAFSIADCWFQPEEDPEVTGSHFESELFLLCRWVRSHFPGRKELAFEGRLNALGYNIGAGSSASEVGPDFLKRLIYELSRTIVRRPVEMNLDLPFPRP